MGIRNNHGKWQIRFQSSGRSVSHCTGLAATERNRSTALEMERELRLEHKTGRKRPQPIAFNDAVARYLEWAREEMTDPTWRSHCVSLHGLQIFLQQLGGRMLAEVNGGDLEHYKTWRRSMGIAPTTLHGNLCEANKFFKWCKRCGWISENPMAEVERPAQQNIRDFHVLSLEEEALYLRAASRYPNLHDLAVLMLDTGMRPEEVLRMRAADVDLAERIVTVQKGKTRAARRRLWMSERVLAVVKKRLAKTGPQQPWLFPSPRYEGLPMTKLNNPHNRVLEEIEAEWVIYDFRHTCATRWAESGMDVATLAALLGHNGLRVVMKYVHPTPKHQIEMMRAAMAGGAGRRMEPTNPGRVSQASPSIRRNDRGGIVPHCDVNAVESVKAGGAGRNRTGG